MRKVPNKVRKAGHEAVKADADAVMNAPGRRRAESAARRLAGRSEPACPKAVARLRNDLDDLLTCFGDTTLATLVRHSNLNDRNH